MHMISDFGTVAFWAEQYFSHYPYQENTRAVQQSYYHLYIRPDYGDRMLSDITRSDMTEYWNNLRMLPIQSGTRSNIYSVWKNICVYAEQQGEIWNHFLDDSLLVGKRKSAVTYAASQPDVDRVMLSKEAPSTVLLLLMARFTGIRRQECLRIRLEDINWINAEIIIPTRRRTYECDVMPYPAFMNAYIERVLEEPGRKDTQWIFAMADGTRWNDSKATHMVRKLLDREHCTPGLTYESFRAAFYSDADLLGMNLTVAESMMGIQGSKRKRWRSSVDWRQLMKNAEALYARNERRRRLFMG